MPAGTGRYMADMSDNPLVGLGYDIPFDRIRAEHVEPAAEVLIGRAKAALAAIGSEASPPTYANTLKALEDATDPLERAMSVVGHLEGVSTTDALRAAYNEVRPKVSELYSSIPLDEKHRLDIEKVDLTDQNVFDLFKRGETKGVASLCIGGGEATAVAIERMN